MRCAQNLNLNGKILEMLNLSSFNNFNFLFGLLLRFFCIFYVSQIFVSTEPELIINFLRSGFTVDVWSDFRNFTDNEYLYSYGYLLYLILWPTVNFLQYILNTEHTIFIILLLFDISLLYILLQTFHNDTLSKNKVFYYYWFSPFVIIPTYLYGFIEIIPITFLYLSFIFIKSKKYLYSCIFLTFALSIKLNIWISLPIFFIYIINSKFLRKKLIFFSAGIFILFICLNFPYFISSASFLSVFINNDVNFFFNKFSVNDSYSIMGFPLVFTLFLYLIWRVGRLNFNLFLAIQGSLFLMLALFSPFNFHWYLWFVPFLINYQVYANKLTEIIFLLFSLFYIFVNLNINEFDIFNLSIFVDYFYTFFIAIGVIILFRIWRDAIYLTDFFRISRSPLVISIAGDSGSGKDTMSNLISDLLGRHSTVIINGDNYHLWDRDQSFLKYTTPLNPIVNDLHALANDLLKLIQGKQVISRFYDHTMGKKTIKQVYKSKDFIINNGLHSLFLPSLRNLSDIKIYLDIDENLRNFFKQKRDLLLRNHKTEISKAVYKKRKNDAIKFIKPQIEHADLIIKLEPLYPNQMNLVNYNDSLQLKINISSRIGADDQKLINLLVGYCGLSVIHENYNYINEFSYSVDGELTSEDVKKTIELLYPDMIDYIDPDAIYHSGINGITQVILINYINEIMKRKLH